MAIQETEAASLVKLRLGSFVSRHGDKYRQLSIDRSLLPRQEDIREHRVRTQHGLEKSQPLTANSKKRHELVKIDRGRRQSYPRTNLVGADGDELLSEPDVLADGELVDERDAGDGRHGRDLEPVCRHVRDNPLTYPPPPHSPPAADEEAAAYGRTKATSVAIGSLHCGHVALASAAAVAQYPAQV